MNYYELDLQMLPFSEEISEIVVAELADFGCDSFVDTTNGVKAYIPENLYNENKFADIVEMFSNLTKITYKKNYIESQDWNAAWEATFTPIVVDERCTIRAPFHTMPKTEYEVLINPKMSFGSGHHATTYMMTDALLNMNVENLNVLDMGCGTAVLAILAALKNAASVDAIDIDDWAYRNAMDNVKLNGVENCVNVLLGDSSLIAGKSYDLILANINRNILVADMKNYAAALKSGGTLIVSGFLVDDIVIIENEAAKFGLRKIKVSAREQWQRIDFVK